MTVENVTDDDDVIIVNDVRDKENKITKNVNKKTLTKSKNGGDEKVSKNVKKEDEEKDNKRRYSLRDKPKESDVSKKINLDTLSPSERYNTKRERLDFPDPEPPRKKPKMKTKK